LLPAQSGMITAFLANPQRVGNRGLTLGTN